MAKCSSAARWDPNMLVELLIDGEEQVKKLEANLGEQASPEFCRALAQNIESTFKKAIKMVKLRDQDASHALPPFCSNNTTPSLSPESPLSPNASPRSETSDKVFKDQERREISKKRKTLPKWSNQVKVNPGAGIEAPLDDGHSWRKYGQKDILGARHPRGYYRCTHRNARGCLATKQVQRSDSDPTIFDVVYRGEHTCSCEKPLSAVAHASASQQTGTQQSQYVAGEHQKQQLQQQQQQENQLLLNFQTNLKVKTEGLDMEKHEHDVSSFSFPSTPIGCSQPRHSFFANQANLDNHFMDSFSPTFLSPTTSESNYFSVSPCRMSNLSTGFNHHTAESEFTEIISSVTSAANSPVVDMGFILDAGEFDAFDPSNFF
ncbi:WRKY domain-containing protein [Dioscorea alata]|uniref:WRKY domain-containing protein n=1 Tax=Dioscorea alata TaxID=55571 RepID=A0ACB7W472_DIOAL|nr:WRKY domain-containing protein [Dioscorea alata]